MEPKDQLEALRNVFPNAAPAEFSDPDCCEQDPDAVTATRVGDAARAQSAGAPPLVPSLDLWTLKPTSKAYVELSVTDFGGMYTEATAVIRPEDYKPPRPGLKRSCIDEEILRSTMSITNQERASERAKRNVRHRVKAMGADRILTLGSRMYMETGDDLWKALREFSILMRRELKDEWAYVAVPELHENGMHWHMHLAIAGHKNVNQVRRLWHTALRRCFEKAKHDHSPGNIDISYKKKTRAAQLNSIARYISKYITKAAHEGFLHRKRYESTRNIPKPTVHKFYLDLSLLTDLRIIRKIQAVSGGATASSGKWFTRAGFDVFWLETEPLPT